MSREKKRIKDVDQVTDQSLRCSYFIRSIAVL